MLYSTTNKGSATQFRYRNANEYLPSKRAVEAKSSSSTALVLLTGGAVVPDPNTENRMEMEKYGNLTPSLASILRPAGASRWMLPSVAAITPQYIEGVLRGALAGNHVQAWELFDIIIDTDPEVTSCVGEYMDGITGKKLVITPYSEGDEEPTAEAIKKAKVVEFALKNMRPDSANDENDFTATIKDILFARFHGQTVMEIDWYKKDGSGLNILNSQTVGQVVCPRSTFWVHPVCYAWDMNGRLGLRMALESQLQEALKLAPTARVSNILGPRTPDKMRSMVEPPAWSWITSQARPSQLMDFPDNKFLIGINKFKSGTIMGSGSCLRPLAWWWIASMFSADWCLNYAQLFGIPFRKATISPATTEPKKAEIRQLLQSMGSAGYIMLDAGNTVEFERAAAGAGESPQSFLAHFANDMKRKVILHQTMSGGSHGAASSSVGKAGMEAEAEGSKDTCTEAGAQYAASVINLQLIPYILNVNFGEGGDLYAPTVSLVDDEVGGMVDAQTLQIVSGLMNVGESHARRLFRIAKPADGEPILGVDTGSIAAQRQQQMDMQQSQMDMQQDQFQQQQEAQQESPEEEEAAEARNALAAKAVTPVPPDAAKNKVAKALKNTAQPLIDRMKAIEAIEDADVKKAALTKLLKDMPKIAASLRKDPELSEAVAQACKEKAK